MSHFPIVSFFFATWLALYPHGKVKPFFSERQKQRDTRHVAFRELVLFYSFMLLQGAGGRVDSSLTYYPRRIVSPLFFFLRFLLLLSPNT